MSTIFNTYSLDSSAAKHCSNNETHSSTNTDVVKDVSKIQSRMKLPSGLTATYQPYPGLINCTQLTIPDNLNGMTEDWTHEEKSNKRRLVQFAAERCHKSNTIKCSFHAIPQAEATWGHDVVSCIYWEECQEYVITSVDCIYLVECILKIEFSVNEKNRIRRNLEGFRPLNVSKYKEETASFFNIIMGYAHPKPRNIVKDIKVFSWRTLPYALKKIVAKYVSAS